MADGVMVTAGDLRLFVREWGDHQSPPVLLLHGITGDHTAWDEVAEHLADRYHVFALDQRGHGASDRPEKYSFRLMAEDMWAVADALGIEKMRLVGHSMGGVVALIAAQLHPDRVTHLVVEEAPPPTPLDRPDLDPPEEEPAYDFALINQIRAELRDPDPANWASVDALPMPSLVLLGGPSSGLPQKEQAELARRIPDVAVETIYVGHNIHRDAAEQFCRLLDDFLA